MKGIDKETFLQYFPLNGLLGERLFAQVRGESEGHVLKLIFLIREVEGSQLLINEYAAWQHYNSPFHKSDGFY